MTAVALLRPPPMAGPMLTHRVPGKLVGLSRSMVARLSRPQYGVESMDSHRRTITQIWGRDTVINFVADAFAKAYPNGTAKRVANDLGISHRTAEKWCAREGAPSLHQFFNALQAIPELKAATMAALDMGELDPDFARALSDLVNAAQRMKP